MTRAYLAFTDTGLALARRLADALPGSVDRCGSISASPLPGGPPCSLRRATRTCFCGAVGIAVRAIAPHCPQQASDPGGGGAGRMRPLCGAGAVRSSVGANDLAVHWPPCAEPFR